MKNKHIWIIIGMILVVAIINVPIKRGSRTFSGFMIDANIWVNQ